MNDAVWEGAAWKGTRGRRWRPKVALEVGIARRWGGVRIAKLVDRNGAGAEVSVGIPWVWDGAVGIRDERKGMERPSKRYERCSWGSVRRSTETGV